MGISDDMHKDFLKTMRGPNFTEGEWQCAELKDSYSVPYWNVYRMIDDKPRCVALFIDSESDARLMAQSKKMYGAMKDTLMILRDLAPYAPCDNESCSHLDCSVVRNIKAILSEIDKED